MTKDHLRPQSRGGNDARSNIKLVDDDIVQRPRHSIFWSLCFDEIILLLFFAWERINPYIQENEPGCKSDRLQNRKKAWDKLFGKNSTKKQAVEFMVVTFVAHADDFEKEKAKEALSRACLCGEISKKEYDRLEGLIFNQE